MNKYFIALFVTVLMAGHAPFAQAETTPASIEQRIANLEQELAALKQQRALEAEAAKTVSKNSPAVELDSRGLSVTSPDKQFQLKLKGFAQFDTRTFIGNSRRSNTDQMLIRTARPAIEAKFFEMFEARAVVDFGNAATRLVDAYADYKPDARLNFRLGKFKPPVGLERLQSEQNLALIERGMATNLVPSRDIGAQLYGSLLTQRLEYQAALTTGTADLSNADGDLDGMKDVTARLFARPMRQSEQTWLQGLGLGVAGSIGEHHGSATSPNLTTGYVTPAQARFFVYRSDAFADGTHWRINPQAYYYYGPFGLLGEYILTGQHVARAGSADTLRHRAWTTTASYVLTGEDARFDGVKPRDNFDWRQGSWGAFEVAARAGGLRVDDAAFPAFADPAVSAQSALDTTVGATWYLNPNIKLNANYSYTVFEGGNASGQDRVSEKVFMTRAQFGF